MDCRPVRKGRFSDMHNWTEQYEKKLTNAAAIAAFVRDHDLVAMTGGGSYPKAFDNALSHHLLETNFKISFISQYLLEEPKLLKSKLRENVTMFSLFMGNERRNMRNGNVQYVPMNLGDTSMAIKQRSPRVVVLNCSKPDENGWMSRSVWGAQIHRNVFESPHCEVLAVEVNENIPYIPSEGDRHLMVHVSEVDYIVEANYTWLEVKSIESTAVEKAIAEYAAEMIKNGNCIQLGVGGLSDAIGADLVYAAKKDLGLHTEVLSNSMAMLMEKGIINNSRKQICRNKTVASYVIGDGNLWKFCRNNKDICLKEIDFVNDPYNLSKNDNVVSINSAMEIDLVGQVASESRGQTQYSGTGGQLQWVMGSQLSKGGKSIIAINSTYKGCDGTVESKIKPILTPGTVVTTPRSCVEYVITEFGVADLRYKGVAERIEALIHIAHPDFRDMLRHEAKKWIY